MDHPWEGEWSPASVAVWGEVLVATWEKVSETVLVELWDWMWGRPCSAVVSGTLGQPTGSRTPACPGTTAPRNLQSLHRNRREQRWTRSNQTGASTTMESGTADS